MNPSEIHAVTKNLFDQVVPDFAFFPHILLKPSEQVLSQVAKIAGIKYGPWPQTPEGVFHYLAEDVCDEPDEFSSWAKVPCQEHGYSFMSHLGMITNECLLVNSEVELVILRSLFPDFVLGSDANIWCSLYRVLSSLDSVGIPIGPDYTFILFVFAKNKATVVNGIVDWAKANQIPWGQVIPPQPPIALSGPIFEE